MGGYAEGTRAGGVLTGGGPGQPASRHRPWLTSSLASACGHRARRRRVMIRAAAAAAGITTAATRPVGVPRVKAEGGAPPGPTDRQILIPTRLTSVTLPCFLPETWAQITSYCSPRVAFRGTVMLAVSVALWRGPRSTAGLLTW